MASIILALALAQQYSEELLPDDPLIGREEAAPAPIQEPPKVLASEPSPTGTRKLLERSEAAGPNAGAFILWTGFVLALMAGGFFLLRRWTRGTRFLAGGGAIDILARKPIGPRQEIFLVGVGPKIFLVGATRDRLSTLGEFANPDQVALLRAEGPAVREEGARAAFRDSLRQGLKEEAPAENAYASIADEIAEIRKTVKAWNA